MNKLFTKVATLCVGLAMAAGVGVAAGAAKAGEAKAAYVEIATFDFSETAESGSLSTQLTNATIKDLLNESSSVANIVASVSNKSGDVYSGKGSGAENVPQRVLKVGKASGGGAFTFTIGGDDYVSKVEFSCYGWKVGSKLSVNSSATQSPETAQVLWSPSFVLETASKSINITVTTSAVCVSSIKLYKDDSVVPPTPVETHDILFNANAGEDTVVGMPEDMLYQSGTVSLANVDVPRRSGYHFVGWALSATGSTVSSVTISDADVNLYAIWQELTPFVGVRDSFNHDSVGVEGTSYVGWENKTFTSDVKYTGNSSGGSDTAPNFQLRSGTSTSAPNVHSGVVSTTSAGKLVGVEVEWHSTAVSGRALDVYGSHSAYASVEDLYDSSKAGTLIGSIACGTAEQLEFSDDYEYIGFRSHDGALFIEGVVVVWESSTPQPTMYTVTYDANGGSGSMNPVEVEENTVHALLPNGFTAPQGKQFKCWSVGGVERAVGYELTVTENVTVSAVWEDIPAAGWGDTILGQFETYLHGIVPHYADSVAALEFSEQYGDFEMPATTQEAAQAQLDVLCADWLNAGEYYVAYSEDELGFARGYLYQESETTFAATIVFVQTAYDEQMIAGFQTYLNGNVPPFISGFPAYAYYSAGTMFVSAAYTDGAYLSYYQSDMDDLGYDLISSTEQSRVVYVAQGLMTGTAHLYEKEVADHGLLAIELFVFSDGQNDFMTVNIYYVVQPVSLLVSGEYKTSYEYGEELNLSGIVVEQVKSDASKTDVTADIEVSGYDSHVSGEQTLTISYGNLSTTIKVTVGAAPVSYDAEDFAEEFLALVAGVCENYDGKKNNKEDLKAIWDTMSQKYDSLLSNSEKERLIDASGKVDGNAIERAVAFYDYACKKYGLSKFIDGRVAHSLVLEQASEQSVLPIIVIVAASVAAVTAIGVVIALKRRKALLAK